MTHHPEEPEHVASLTGRIAGGVLCGGFVALLAWMFVTNDNPVTRLMWRQSLLAGGMFSAIFLVTIVFGLVSIRGPVRTTLLGVLNGAVTAVALSGLLAGLEFLAAGEKSAGRAFGNVLSLALPTGAVLGGTIGCLMGLVLDRKRRRAARLSPYSQREAKGVRRRPLPMSRLRPLVFFVLAVFMGILLAQRPLLRLAAIAQIRAGGGSVEYDRFVTSQAWLAEGILLMGDNYLPIRAVDSVSLKEGATDQQLHALRYLPEVKSVHLSGSGITDAGLASLQGLSSLNGLTLSGSQLTDAGLAYLSQLTGLQYIALNNTGVSGPGLVHLASLTRPIVISLRGTKITDDGLAHLPPVASIMSLDLGHTQITDAGLTHIAKLPGLIGLHLEKTHVWGEGLVHLANLPRLSYLQLRGTQVTDEHLVHLAGIVPLQTLDLSDTPITGAGLVSLANLPRLTSLQLENTKITDAGLASLLQLPTLGHVNLDGTAITDDGLAQLAQHPTLSGLGLRRTAITEAGLERLASLLKQRPPILGGTTGGVTVSPAAPGVAVATPDFGVGVSKAQIPPEAIERLRKVWSSFHVNPSD